MARFSRVMQEVFARSVPGRRLVTFPERSGLTVGTWTTASGGCPVAGLVLLARQVFPADSPAAVAASTLAVAALFSPVRRRVQQVVDRRFNRVRYDADRMVEAFAVRLKDATDLDRVRADLADVVSQALEPTHVTVWTTPGS